MRKKELKAGIADGINFSGVPEYQTDETPLKSEPVVPKTAGKRGRPKVEQRMKQYTLTLPPDLKKLYDEYAKDRYMSFSGFMRAAADEYIANHPTIQN